MPVNTTGTHTNTGTVKVSDGTVADDVASIPLSWSVDHWEWSSPFTSNVAGTSKTITATYYGDSNYSGNSDTDSHTVNQANTTTTVSSDINPSVTGEEVEFTATVTATAPGSGTPAGTVTLRKGSASGTLIGSGALNGSGVATISSITFNASEDPVAIFAVYDEDEGTVDDDPDYSTSTSAEYTQWVNKANTTTTITNVNGQIPPADTATYVGVSYTVKGTVTVSSPGEGTLTGQITVSDGTLADDKSTTTFTLDSGTTYTWTVSFTSNTAGDKTLTATYSDSTSQNYNGSTGTASHLVNQKTVTITITPTSLTAGTGKSFTATLSPTTATGDITFQIKDKNGITLLNSGPHNLSSGIATSDTLELSASDSPVSVTATYSGDDDFAAGQATQAVEVYTADDFAITGHDPDPSPVGATITVTWNHSSGGSFPETGNLVISMTDGTNTASKTVTVSGGTSTASTSLNTAGIVAGTWPLTATYTGTVTTSSPPSYSAVTVYHKVTPRETETSVTGTSTTCVSQTVLLTATVTDKGAPPDGPGFTGTISWSSDGSGIFDPVTCEISHGGTCSTYYTPVAGDVGTVHIKASYSGDDAYGSSRSPDFDLAVGKRSTGTTVFGSDTPLVVGDTATFLVTVSDTSSCVPTIPTGGVSVTVSPSGAGILTAPVSVGAGQFTFTYTPISKADTTHEFTATYTGSTTHNGSDGAFVQVIIGRAADIQMSVAPTTAYVYQPVTIAIHVADDTTAGIPLIPAGTVTLAVDDGSGTFDHSSYTLDGNGNCTAVYVPDPLFDDGTDDHTNPLKTITATYSGSNLHAVASTIGHLNVILRPTTTTVVFATSQGILVNEHTTFTVTVADAAGVAGTVPSPDGTIYKTKSLEPKSEGVIGLPSKTTLSGGRTRWTYSYYRTALDSEGGAIDIINATYTPDDGVYAGSTAPYGKDISRRPTQTTISNPIATATGIEYDIIVEEDPSAVGHGLELPITGDFVEKGGTDITETDVGDAPGLAHITKTLPLDEQGSTLLVNATVHYVPNDRVHMTSLDSVNVDRSAFITAEPPTDPSNDGSDCNGGCGDGGTNIVPITPSTAVGKCRASGSTGTPVRRAAIASAASE